MSITTHDLSPENAEKAGACLEELDMSAWVRWWNESCVQLDGDFTLEELEMLVALMKSFEPREKILHKSS